MKMFETGPNAITKADDLYKSIRFCALAATGPRAMNYALQHLKVENCFMYGTDGHRLHRAPVGSDIPDGYYRVDKILKNSVTLTRSPTFLSTNNWPDAGYIMAVDYGNAVTALLQDTESSAGLDESTNLAAIYRAMPEDECLQYRFVNDVTAGREMTAHILGPSDPVKFTSDNGLAAWIMPMRG